MTKKSDKEKNKKRIEDEFEQINSESSDIDLSKNLAKMEDIPDLGEIDIYDYDSDLTVATEKSDKVLQSLVDLYLNDVPQIKENPYIKNKMREDAMVYAEAIFLSKMTRRNFLNQLQQVDNGENSARMHEVINQTIGQIRENSKFLSSQRTDLEKFYKNLRDDLGLNKLEMNEKEKEESKTENEKEEEKKNNITDNRKMNEMIKEAMIKKDSSDKNNRKNKSKK